MKDIKIDKIYKWIRTKVKGEKNVKLRRQNKILYTKKSFKYILKKKDETKDIKIDKTYKWIRELR